LCLIGVAAIHAHNLTRSLRWPYDDDLFRDIASAQTMLEGDWLADPYYAHESLWYNPLVPAIVAVTSRATHIPLHRLYAADGWAFNLVVPIALVCLVWRLVNRWVALAALAAFIFLPAPLARRGRGPVIRHGCFQPSLRRVCSSPA
jgi:hypothetical protein